VSDPTSIVQLGTKAAPPAPPAREYALPYTVSLPTRYYGRLAIEDVARTFAEICQTETKVVDGAFEVTFKAVDAEAGPHVIDEFLNHVLYRSATAGDAGGAR
jgi:hypothetical protein